MSSLILVLLAVSGVGAVYGGRQCPRDSFGAGCRHACYCRVNTTCDDDTGRCAQGCALGWEDEACQTRDVAFVMPAVVKGDRGNASWAVDADVGTCATALGNNTGWWKVDLLRDFRLFRFRIATIPEASLWGWRVFISPYDNVFFTSPCTTLRLRSHVAEVTCDTPMTGQYVGVLATPGPFHLCDFRLLVCEAYSFGLQDCSRRCQCRDAEEVCDPVYGTCRSGCQAGWTGGDCHAACSMAYGEGCVHSCGHCAGGAQCDRLTGHCHGGCEPGWTGQKCQAQCPSGWWGRRCRQQCGHCLERESCEPTRGACKSGCQSGWMGHTCLTECSWGRHGENCEQQCGRCRSNTTCDRHKGICSHGCQDGYEGVFCDHGCLYGRYGQGCAKHCGKCANPPCDVTTGHCDEAGCLDGWSGPLCMSKCGEGRFGADCQESCGHCQGGSLHCYTGNGTCLQGCLPGWNGSQCLQPCAPGFHGQDCLSACGHCAESAPCDHVTGNCPDGCEEKFTGSACTKPVGVLDAGGDVVANFMGISVGMVGSVLGIVVFCLILKWRREYTIQEVDASRNREEQGTLM